MLGVGRGRWAVSQKHTWIQLGLTSAMDGVESEEFYLFAELVTLTHESLRVRVMYSPEHVYLAQISWSGAESW